MILYSMPTKRNQAYRQRKNRKQAWRRRQKRRNHAMAPLINPTTAAAIQLGFVPPEQVFDLWNLGSRLSAVKRAVWNLVFCGIRPPSRSGPTMPKNLIFGPHRHDAPKWPNRHIELSHLWEGLSIISFRFIFYIMPLKQFSGTVRGYHRCPFEREGENMRVFPAPATAGFYIRCHKCGWSLLALEFMRRDHIGQYSSLEDVAAQALQDGIVSEPVSPEAIACLRSLTGWRDILDAGREAYAFRNEMYGDPANFGDWALVSDLGVAHLVEGGVISTRALPKHPFVRVCRNAFGFPTSITVFSEHLSPWAELRFSPERFLFDAPRWADFTDWSRDLIVCPNTEMAVALERAVTKWSPERKVGVVTVAEAREPLTGYNAPFSNVWLPVLRGQSAEYGLAFSGCGINARVKHFDSDLNAIEGCSREDICDPSLPACVDVVARDLADDGRSLGALFSTLLIRPDISAEVGQELVARTAALKGMPVEEVAAGIETVASPFAARLGNDRYLNRGGVFLKENKHGKFVPISNFTAQIVGPKDRNGTNPMLNIRLTTVAGCTSFSMTDAAFNNPQRLWKAVRAAAQKASLPYPTMTAVPDRKLLPEIIRGTRAGL
jgi:hypothetical protein